MHLQHERTQQRFYRHKRQYDERIEDIRHPVDEVEIPKEAQKGYVRPQPRHKVAETCSDPIEKNDQKDHKDRPQNGVEDLRIALFPPDIYECGKDRAERERKYVYQ